jgi:signal peptidase I
MIIISRIAQRALTIFLIILLCGNSYYLVSKFVFKNDLPMLFGYGNAIIVSGSMEPAISVDDMIVFRKQREYSVGDIVLYNDGFVNVTHRIVEINGDQVITKGDANNAADKPFLKSAIKGKVLWSVPGIGRLINFIITPLGLFLIVISALLII